MKVNLLPAPKDLMLGTINQQFANDETDREYIESLFWPNGAVCTHCHNITSKIESDGTGLCEKRWIVLKTGAGSVKPLFFAFQLCPVQGLG